MNRATPLAFCAAIALLAGCGKQAPGPDAASTNLSAATENDEIEALPSDGLAAPEGMAIDSESGSGEEASNAGGSASGGNAM